VARRYRIPLPALAGASLALVTTALLLVFFVVPNDLNQGFSQRIFYFHVSIAFTAYLSFGFGAWKALLHLWKRDPNADLEENEASMSSAREHVRTGEVTQAVRDSMADVGKVREHNEDALIVDVKFSESIERNAFR